MHMSTHRTSSPAPIRQGGAALLVGLMLLVIMTVMTVFAVNIGVFEQRASSNELRAGESFRAAESGIAAVLEFFKANQADMVDEENATGWFAAGNVRWTACTANPAASDPCNEQYIDPYLLDAGGYRGTVYKYQVGGSNFVTVPNLLNMTDATLDFDVMALLCFFDVDANTCRPQANSTSDLIVQLISFGQSDISGGLAEGSSEGVISQVFAPFRLINAEVAAPVVVANSFASTGSFEIVTNPNGGGSGVPVSIWTPAAAFPNGGNARTCNVAEFFSTSTPVQSGGTTICNTCSCPTLGGNLDTDDMVWVPLTDGGFGGEDVIDQATDFPSDLFKYIFSYPATQWKELKAKAQSSGTVVDDCSTLNSQTSGLVWVTGNCRLGNGVTASASKPMLLIAGCGDFRLASGGVTFGLIYVDNLEDGCSAVSVSMGGNSKVYGALVVDGVADSSGGTPSIVYNRDVLNKLSEDPSFSAWGPIPGTWHDYAQN